MVRPIRPGAKKVRFNIDLSQDSHERLERLLEKTDAASKGEVVRRAIQLFAAIEGNELEFRYPDGTITKVVIV